MSESFPTSADRAEILLQRYFEGCITEQEAEDLADFWDRNPDFDAFALKNHEIEQHFQFFGRLGNHPMVPSSNENVALRPVDSPFPRHDVSHRPSELDFDSLVRLAEESKALPISPKNRATKKKAKSDVARFSTFKTGSPTSKAISKGYSRGIRIFLLTLLVVIPVMIHQFHGTSLQEEQNNLFPARVVSVVEPVFAENTPIFKRNQAIDGNMIHLISGKLELELKNKVRIVLEGETSFDIQTTLKTFCRKGRLSIEVPKGAEGFEVKTPFMNIRDLGTKFVVEVSDTESRVHVIEGRVEIDALNGHVTERSEGMGMIVRSGGSVEQIRADNSLFVERTRMKQTETLYEDALHAALTRHQSRLIREPDLLALVDFSSGPDALAKGSFETVRGRKTVGRWFGRTAFSFESPKDTVRLSVPGRSRSVTLFAVVRLKDLSHPGNILFSLGGMDKGSLRWQINQSGDLQLMLGKQDGSSFADHAAPKALRKADCETWLTVATVLDAKNRTVTHYLDGKEIASLPLTEDAEYDFSQSEIGNGRPATRNATAKRFFNGQIEEFILIGRPLTFNEITELK